MTTIKLTSDLPTLLESMGIPWMHGDIIRCQCPVHGGGGNNFTFYTDNCTWKCWSHQCHETYGSDLVGLISGVHGCTREQAKTLGLAVVADKPIIRERKIRKNKIIDATELLDQSNIVPFFLKKGFTIDTLKEFKVFVCTNPKKKLYNRAIVPLFDENDNLIGFTGRTLTNSTPKWLHTPKSLVKSNILYGLNIAKHYLYDNTLCLVEGPTDVWRLHECGIKNSAGLLGTTISQNQIKLLKSYGVTTIIIIVDPDNAGMHSMLKPNGLCDKLMEHFTVYTLRHILTDDIGDTPKDIVESKLKPEIIRITNEY